jgi:hypothetical protein
MDARGEERPFGEESEAHCGREFLGLRGGVSIGRRGYAKNGVRPERRGTSSRPIHRWRLPRQRARWRC